MRLLLLNCLVIKHPISLQHGSMSMLRSMSTCVPHQGTCDPFLSERDFTSHLPEQKWHAFPQECLAVTLQQG